MEPPSSHVIEVLNESGLEISTATIRQGVESALNLEGAEPSEVNVLLTTEENVRDLNARFRGIESSTDVLTFPSGESASGDIAIAVPYAIRQSALRQVSLEQELAYLAIHGALHLVGYDDQSDDERDEMIRKMNRVAESVFLPPDENWGSILHEVEA